MRTDCVSAMTGTAAGEHEHHDMVAVQAYGFWIYLMSDLVLFSALFATYAVLCRNFAGGPTGKELFHLPSVFVETMLLLVSSAAFGLTVPAMHKGDKRAVLLGLLFTFLLGLGFIGMEITEFYRLIQDGSGPQRSGFLSAFFTLVGTHGAHVSLGLVWMTVMMAQVAAKGLTTPVQSRLMRLGMYWHFLDLVWIGVFTIVYLMGVLP